MGANCRLNMHYADATASGASVREAMSMLPAVAQCAGRRHGGAEFAERERITEVLRAEL
jgi:hypothetical protein